MVLDTRPLGGFHFMLSIDYTQKLLNLQGVLVKKVTSVHSFTMIDIEMPVTSHVCPHCGTHTSYVHDYRKQLIKDIPAFGQSVNLKNPLGYKIIGRILSNPQ